MNKSGELISSVRVKVSKLGLYFSGFRALCSKTLNSAHLVFTKKKTSGIQRVFIDCVSVCFCPPERRKKASAWEKNLLYPFVMLILLTGTVSI